MPDVRVLRAKEAGCLHFYTLLRLVMIYSSFLQSLLATINLPASALICFRTDSGHEARPLMYYGDVRLLFIYLFIFYAWFNN